jgi:hypothetical protein
MDGDGSFQFLRNPQLREKNPGLIVRISIFYCMIQTDFPNSGSGAGVEKIAERALPIRCSILDVLRMESEGGNDFFVSPSEFAHLSPIRLAGAAAA